MTVSPRPGWLTFSKGLGMTEPSNRIWMLSERTLFSKSGAGKMQDRCAFTSRDMSEDWPEAFTYAIVMGWDADPEDSDNPDDGWTGFAERFGWDAPLIEFLRDAHRRFNDLDSA